MLPFLSSNACPNAVKSNSFGSLWYRPITSAFTKMEFSGIESRLYIFLRGLNIGASLLHDLLQVLIQKLRSLPCRSTAIRYGRSPWYIKKSLLIWQISLIHQKVAFEFCEVSKVCRKISCLLYSYIKYLSFCFVIKLFILKLRNILVPVSDKFWRFCSSRTSW